MTKVDLTGKKFGRLTVIKDDGTRDGRAIKWLCRCECGKYIHVRGNMLKNGHTRSCGCLQLERAREYGSRPGVNKITTPTSRSTTGVRGVYKKRGLYEVTINIHKKQTYLGRYKTLEEAVKVRRKAEEKYGYK